MSIWYRRAQNAARRRVCPCRHDPAPDLLAFVSSDGRPLKGTFVTCDGFVNYNVDTDDGSSTDPMVSDSRGRVYLTTWGELTTICYAVKTGYKSWTQEIRFDHEHLRQRFTLEEV